MKNRQFPMCCGARMLYDFFAYEEDNWDVETVSPEKLDAWLKKQLADDHPAFFLAILNRDEYGLEKTFKDNGFKKVTEGFNYGGIAREPLRMYVWSRPRQEIPANPFETRWGR